MNPHPWRAKNNTKKKSRNPKKPKSAIMHSGYHVCARKFRDGYVYTVMDGTTYMKGFFGSDSECRVRTRQEALDKANQWLKEYVSNYGTLKTVRYMESI